MLDVKRLGEYIRETRIKRGLSQRELAARVGVNASTITRYEQGKFTNVKQAVVYEIFKALDAADPFGFADDAVKVVRCKDCIYRETEDCAWRDDDDFCSMGETRKERDVSNELKPCPFCGGQARIADGMTVVLTRTERGIKGMHTIFIKCRQCGAAVSFDNNECDCNPGEAVKYFNRRESI